MFGCFNADGVNHLMGTPLIEIHHVTTHFNPTEKLDTQLEIYGSIEITNALGRITTLYDQPEGYPETISFGDDILALIDIHPIYSPFPITMIRFHLMDKTNGHELVNDSLTLDYTEKSIKFEEKGEKVVCCKDGHLKVSFTAYESAVMASLDFQIWKENESDKTVPDDNDDNIAVVGTIVASYDSKYSFSKPFTTTFLHVEPEHTPLLVKCRENLPLDKSQTAVPAYSTLSISVCFTDLMIVSSVTIPVRNAGHAYHKIKGSGAYYMKVFVSWTPGNIYGEKRQEKDPTLPSPPSRLISAMQKKLLAVQRQEVYSFVIIPDEKLYPNQVVKLHGQVEFVTTDGIFPLFKATQENPICFQRDQDKTFYVNIGYRRRGDHCSKLQVKLMDMKDDIFCQGFISWHPQVEPDVETSSFPWYDRFLCSTINGEYGLVKVYHSIFHYAVPAIVRIFPYVDGGCRELCTGVSGRILARYDQYAYDCRYYNDHFQNVLFSESPGSPSSISIGEKKIIEWLKSAISVPCESDLIIELDLCLNLEEFKNKSPLANDTVKGVATFEMGWACSKDFQWKDLIFKVVVEWPHKYQYW